MVRAMIAWHHWILGWQTIVPKCDKFDPCQEAQQYSCALTLVYAENMLSLREFLNTGSAVPSE